MDRQEEGSKKNEKQLQEYQAEKRRSKRRRRRRRRRWSTRMKRHSVVLEQISTAAHAIIES